MTKQNRKIRIAIPSKGLLAEGSIKLFSNVGLPIYSPNPRQYIAHIHSLPNFEVILQRPGDIVISVQNGSVDFGITGKDIYLEKQDRTGKIIELNTALGYGKCTLDIIVPNSLDSISSLSDITVYQSQLGRPLRIASKFPKLTKAFFEKNVSFPFEVIQAEGALEIAPTIGYADIIVDLVSTGTTLRDNQLKQLSDGKILDAEACLIANKERLKNDQETLEIATQLLEMIGAHLRAKQNLAIFANIKAPSENEIIERISNQKIISGLQGPTLSKIISNTDQKFFAIHIVVLKANLQKAIKELREIGGSGVVVSPVDFIFEEEPKEIVDMLDKLEL